MVLSFFKKLTLSIIYRIPLTGTRGLISENGRELFWLQWFIQSVDKINKPTKIQELLGFLSFL